MEIFKVFCSTFLVTALAATGWHLLAKRRQVVAQPAFVVPAAGGHPFRVVH